MNFGNDLVSSNLKRIFRFRGPQKVSETVFEDPDKILPLGECLKFESIFQKFALNIKI